MARMLLFALAICALPVPSEASLSRGSTATAIFRFHTDEFWLNLHHFLYVLGRAENKTRDSSREAVAGAPLDAPQIALTDTERSTWHETVDAYASGPSRRDVVFDAPLPSIARALGSAGDSAALDNPAMPAELRAILERAAPIYRRAWWPAHREANRAWAASQQALVERHGEVILAFVTRAFGMDWPRDGFPVHVSAYTNWAGAYATDGNLLVVSSLDPSLAGADGLETVFHEGMHQWDDQVGPILEQRAAQLGVPVPENLAHALIFFTAGEAVRRSIPDHVPYADAHGVWARGWTNLRNVLADAWAPYLGGRGTRDEAVTDTMRRLAQ